jgi:hypothetical protein
MTTDFAVIPPLAALSGPIWSAPKDLSALRNVALVDDTRCPIDPVVCDR